MRIEGADLFDKSNLAAWCIVPFDAQKRSPEARAEMVEKMGLTKIAYDWRPEHVAKFEQVVAKVSFPNEQKNVQARPSNFQALAASRIFRADRRRAVLDQGREATPRDQSPRYRLR